MHIVVVEDNAVLAKSILQVLKHEGYATTHLADGAQAFSWLALNQSSYDLAILDVLLPGMDGFTLSKRLRTEHQLTVPILMLTSKGSAEDIVQGLDSGADDYLKKPFAFKELLARIRSLLRRKGEPVESNVALTPDITIDTLAQRVTKKGKEVHLTAKEFAILLYFLRNPNVVVNQQDIYDHVFDFAELQLSNTIEVHVKNLRKKLKTTHHELPLITIRGAGYRLTLN